MSAGRWVSSITLAMVKVLPEPVTPSRTWLRSLALAPSTRSAIACGWSPAGVRSVAILIFMPPSDFSGRAGRCGVQSLPFLCSGLPLSMRSDSACTVLVLAVPASDFSASSIDMSRPATALSPAAARARGSVVPPMDVPREVLAFFSLTAERAPPWPARAPRTGSDARSRLPPSAVSLSRAAAFLRCLPAAERIARFSSLRRARTASSSACLAMSDAQSAIEPDAGAPSKEACGASPKPVLSSSREEVLRGDLAMAGIWDGDGAKGRPCWRQSCANSAGNAHY